MTSTGSGSLNPTTEVTTKVGRRRFSAKYKKRILDEAATCTEVGAMGALLRREGLYSSHLSKWRRQAQDGELSGLEPKQRGPTPQVADPRDKRLVAMEQELTAMTRRAQRAEALVELQKKVSELLGLALERPEELT